MPYTTNPHLQRLRMEAANLVLRQGWSTRDVARHYRSEIFDIGPYVHYLVAESTTSDKFLKYQFRLA